MARASSVTSTPDYRKKRHALAPPALADEEAALHMDEPADEEAKDSVSKQLFHEQDMGAAVSKEDLAVGIHEPTEQLLESPSTQDRDVSDDQLTQSAAAIFNTLSLRGKPGMQKAETEPRETRASKASLERRKRQTPVNAPVSPSKRSTPAAVAADKARASGIGKLERPAFVYGNLSKRKTRARKDTSNVLESSHKPRKMKTAVRATSSVPSDTRESQTASASAADADGAAHSTKPTMEENKAVQGEDEGEGNDRPEQLGTTTNSARSERLKKSKAGRSANQPTLEPRATRSADRNLRNSGVEVVISAPDWSKKPEDALKTKKGSNSTTRHPGRPRTLGREARASVQVDNGAKPIPSSRKPAARVTKPGTRISARNGGRGAVNPRSNTRKQEDHGQNKKGQDHVHEQDLVDGNEEEAEHEEADERIEEGGEEITTRSSGPAENEVAVDVVGTEADDHDEPDGYLSDGVAGDQLEMDHSAQDEDDEEDSDHETANGKPQVEMPFEQQANWDKVLEGAESVGVSQRNGVTRRRKPKLVTKTVKALVRLSSALTQLYMEHGTLYADRENMDEDSVERLEPLRKALDHGLRVLGSRIENIDEDHAGAEKNEMIRDIYTHGIPGLVFLLQAVLLCFVNAPRIRDSDIQLIIRTQTLVLHLCEKAVNWTAKPESDRPIIRSTRQFILPYLREINNVFLNELRQRKRSVERERHLIASRRKKERKQERERLEREQYEREQAERFERVKAELDWEEEEINYLRRRRGTSLVRRSNSLPSQPQADATYEGDLPGDSDPPIELVQIFGRRGEDSFSREKGVGKVIRDQHIDNMAGSWSIEEREWLMIGLQMYQEPDRYDRIIDDYGQSGQPLQNKTFDDLVQRAREEKSNVEGYLAMHGQDLPDWLCSV